MNTQTYTIERLRNREDFNSDVIEFFLEEGEKLSSKFKDDNYDWKTIDLLGIAKRGVVLVCVKDGKYVGFIIGCISPSIFDRNILILQQVSFYAMEGCNRAAWHLFNKFIDIGKKEANHIITMICSQTNIKGTTLERLFGFKKLETLYRLEV